MVALRSTVWAKRDPWSDKGLGGEIRIRITCRLEVMATLLKRLYRVKACGTDQAR